MEVFRKINKSASKCLMVALISLENKENTNNQGHGEKGGHGGRWQCYQQMRNSSLHT